MNQTATLESQTIHGIQYLSGRTLRAPNVHGYQFTDMPDAVVATEAPSSPTIEKVTKRAMLAAWLKEKHPVRSALTNDELMRQARSEITELGTFSTRTFEAAIKDAYQNP